jgi:uncharacterized protein (DUF1800 family)
MQANAGMIATNRFGLGARPGEAARAADDPRGWLLAQLEQPHGSVLADAGLPDSRTALTHWYAFQSERRKAREKADGDEAAMREAMSDVDNPRAALLAEIAARTRFAIGTPQSFRERLVRFWSNHFTVSTARNAVVPVAGAFEREVIRPHVTGSFTDLLVAAETHPAMLLYLDNAQSVGPNSRAGRRRGRGLNENLAREILELHTLGVDGGYDQADVTEFARVLTGWTVGTARDGQAAGQTWFDERRHEPGRRQLLGKTWAESGREQALAVLRDLAVRPETARFIATRLARQFIADAPPAAAVQRIERAFRDSGGQLAAVYAALVNSAEAWVEAPAKFKTPEEFRLSVFRGLPIDEPAPRILRSAYESLGQVPFAAPSPAGWADEAAAWLGPDAVRKRLEWSQATAARLGPRLDPRAFLEHALGATASTRTRLMVAGADSVQQGLVLAMMAPEFQRR